MPTDPRRAPLAGDRAAHSTALVVLDMFGDWSFPDADRLGAAAAAIAPRIARLKRRCAAAGAAVVFVNDNDGRWRSDAPSIVSRAAAGSAIGTEIGRHLVVDETDYFVLKPKHSAFFATPLDLLLRHLKVRRIWLSGVAAERCIEQTAREAKMRDYDVVVVRDGVAGVVPAATAAALDRLAAEHDIRAVAAARLRWTGAAVTA